jgi:hypothetical protein
MTQMIITERVGPYRDKPVHALVGGQRISKLAVCSKESYRDEPASKRHSVVASRHAARYGAHGLDRLM